MGGRMGDSIHHIIATVTTLIKKKIKAIDK
jgi:hypothetical protein